MKKKNKKTKKQNTLTEKHASMLSRVRKGIAHIKVIGLGGGGGNAVSRMFEGNRLRGVEFIAVNTDAQDLDHASAHKKIYVGKALTRGLGAGMNPEIGKQAAEENRSELGEVMEGADVLFLTAGLGGGTGSGTIPVVAEIAREKGILTVAIVTKPFAFEGSQRATIAQEALARLKDKVDALVVIPNDRIFSVINKDTPILRAFSYIDDVLRHGVQAIAELINVPGIVNVDFADIKAILRDSGTTLIGIGIASGQDRSMKAVNEAINSPLLEVSIDGARGVLFSIAGGKDLKMSEVHDIAKAISANLDPNARVIFGAFHDRTLKDKSLKVVVIATGFNGVFNQRTSTPTLFIGNELPIRKEVANPTPVREKSAPQSSGEIEKEKASAKGVVQKNNDEPWEIPAFLRKRKK